MSERPFWTTFCGAEAAGIIVGLIWADAISGWWIILAMFIAAVVGILSVEGPYDGPR